MSRYSNVGSLKKDKSITPLDRKLRKEYGISLACYEGLKESQKGKCAICGNPPREQRLSVDHCHDTKIVRGLLCKQCNLGLGYFKDNPKSLKRAIKYLYDFYGKNGLKIPFKHKGKKRQF